MLIWLNSPVPIKS